MVLDSTHLRFFISIMITSHVRDVETLLRLYSFTLFQKH